MLNRVCRRGIKIIEAARHCACLSLRRPHLSLAPAESRPDTTEDSVNRLLWWSHFLGSKADVAGPEQQQRMASLLASVIMYVDTPALCTDSNFLMRSVHKPLRVPAAAIMYPSTLSPRRAQRVTRRAAEQEPVRELTHDKTPTMEAPKSPVRSIPEVTSTEAVPSVNARLRTSLPCVKSMPTFDFPTGRIIKPNAATEKARKDRPAPRRDTHSSIVGDILLRLVREGAVVSPATIGDLGGVNERASIVRLLAETGATPSVDQMRRLATYAWQGEGGTQSGPLMQRFAGAEVGAQVPDLRGQRLAALTLAIRQNDAGAAIRVLEQRVPTALPLDDKAVLAILAVHSSKAASASVARWMDARQDRTHEDRTTLAHNVKKQSRLQSALAKKERKYSSRIE